MLTTAPSLVFAEQRPELRNLWTRYRPKRWPAGGGLWLDLGSGRLGAGGPRGSERLPGPEGLAPFAGGESVPPALDDVVYLPPVAAELADWRESLIRGLRELGTPVVAQSLLGDPAPPSAAAGSPPAVADRGLVTLCDPLERIAELETLRSPHPASVLLLPTFVVALLGWERFDRWSSTARELGWSTVHVLSAELEPGERRRLLERWGDDAAFDALFHAPIPGEIEVARRLSAAGLEPIVPRPLPDRPERLRRRRELSGLLALCGELWLRSPRPVGSGQELLRAARWLDHLDYDLEALEREGNLRVLPALEGLSLEVAEQWMRGAGSGLLDALRREVLAAEPATPVG